MTIGHAIDVVMDLVRYIDDCDGEKGEGIVNRHDVINVELAERSKVLLERCERHREVASCCHL